jgi:tRNA(Ile)-lysidine synthase
MAPGDRVGVGVSGGADSVALLRLLMELRAELGLVLSVVHFNHQIRGADADADEQFVHALADHFGLPFLSGSGDARAQARATHSGLETAARELRYAYFQFLCTSGTVGRIATAHTLDDQAETVLLRLVRGAWTRGLSGIHPLVTQPPQAGLAPSTAAAERGEFAQPGSIVVRPLLKVQRRELEEYLRSLGQDWREDATNRELDHVRNRVRHTLLPLLEREFNPGVRQTLAGLAEIAQGEEEYWRRECCRAIPGVLHQPMPVSGTGEGFALDEPRREPFGSRMPEHHLVVERLRALPVALQRRLVRELLRGLGPKFSHLHVEQILRLSAAPAGTRLELPGGLKAERLARCPGSSPPGSSLRQMVRTVEGDVGGTPELVLYETRDDVPTGYEYSLALPGQVCVPQAGIVVQAQLVQLAEATAAGYNPSELLNPHSLSFGAEHASSPRLQLRNWRRGDYFWPAHAKAPKKVKELLQARHVSGAERKLWPVAADADGKLVWLRGFGVAEPFLARSEIGEAVLIRETRTGS